MARKNNQQKNGAVRQTSNHKKTGSYSDFAVQDAKVKGKASEVKIFPGEELPNSRHSDTCLKKSVIGTHQAVGENEFIEDPGKSSWKEKHGMDEIDAFNHSVCSGNCSGDQIQELSSIEEASEGNLEKQTSPGCNHGPKHIRGVFYYLKNCFNSKNAKEVDSVMVRNLRAFAISTFELVCAWLDKQRPHLMSLKTKIYSARDNIKLKMEQAYPVILKWLMHFGNIMLVLTMVWLDCTIRGIDSFVRMGTTSLFSVLWCSIFSVISMVGVIKFLIVLVASAILAVFIGFALAVLLVAISGAAFLWFYGSFWMTLFVIFLGGLAFTLSHERIALLITTLYSVYCAWIYVGWMGLLLALNLSFISSDALIYYLRNNVSSRGPDAHQEQTNGVHSEPGFFYSDTTHASFSESGPELSADHGPGAPSTSGVDTEITAEDEVLRLLSCSDHYSALGLSRYQDVDIMLLKREYKKKAMLVHPDKNMGNEKAAEAFKKLQNAYEVLLDSLKRKAYDDELRREELLSYFRRFQNASDKNGRHGFFASGFARAEADTEDPFGDSRRIACKKCGNFHVWVHTKKSKSQARWCQECKEFHQAKDGDGWVEQSSQPFFFGLLQKVDAPSAYVCADSKIYNATEWYICQGMRCPANTHKPSFHVNTSVTSRHGTGRGSSSGQRGGRMPPPNSEETMTEEEFFEWLQNAVQAGVFENFSAGMSSEGTNARAGGGSKSAGSNSSGGSANKRKKKGKKQW